MGGSMQRGPTGRCRTTTALGETVRAIVPHPLPPYPSRAMGTARQA
jgi:hypothetical protein